MTAVMNGNRLITPRWPCIALCVVAMLCSMQTACSSVPPAKEPVVQPEPPLAVVARPTLRVMTLNLAHGRKDGVNQLFRRAGTIRNNLEDITAFLDRTGADIVALQEADAPSRWSGNFDHVALLAREAGYPVFESSNQASNWFFSYGTALLSRVALSGVVHHTFRPSPPTMNKGFTLGQFAWQPETGEPVSVDIVSVHLDFSRRHVRERQSAELGETLAGRGNPMIVMGDFNSDWSADEQVLRALAERIGLHVYRPESNSLGTYRSGTRRFDWILISRQLEFVSFEVLPDILSDHAAVVAEIAIKSPGETGGALQVDAPFY